MKFSKILSIMLINLLILAIFSGCFSRKIENKPSIELPFNNEATKTVESYDIGKITSLVNIEYNPMELTAQIPPYSTNTTLSNIENVKKFGDFSPIQRQLLSNNNFFVSKTYTQNFYNIYFKNNTSQIPSFITSDSILKLYEDFFKSTYNLLKKEQLYKIMIDLTNSMYSKSASQMLKTTVPIVKKSATNNTLYFAVAQRLLGVRIDSFLPKDLKDKIEKEVELIESAKYITKSNIYPIELDYRVFKIDENFKDPDLIKFQKVMAWYSNANFSLDEHQRSQVISVLLMNSALFYSLDSKTLENWEKIFFAYSYFQEKDDNLNPYHFRDLLNNIYGKTHNIDSFDDDDKFTQLLIALDSIPNTKIDLVNSLPTNFKFFNIKDFPDLEILKALSNQKRSTPRGIDIMGIIGSSRATDILLNTYKEAITSPEYFAKFNNYKNIFIAFNDKKWQSTYYYSWLWSLKSLMMPYSKGYPSFMTNLAWEDKSLSTSLGSWVQLHHEINSFPNDSSLGIDNDFKSDSIKGYIEPTIEFYQKILWLNNNIKENLKIRNLFTIEMDNRFSKFTDLLTFLINCSNKELSNEHLTDDEFKRIENYGYELKNLTYSNFDNALKTEDPQNTPLITNVFSNKNMNLEEALGNVSEIYVIVPIEEKLYISKGAVYNYYEFTSSVKLNDSEWLQILQYGKPPIEPAFTKSFAGGIKK